MIEQLKRIETHDSPYEKFLIGIVLLYLAYGQEAFSYSLNIDDYYQAYWPPNFGSAGRYMLELFYEYVLFGQFVPFFAFSIGFSLIIITVFIFCGTLDFKSNLSFYIVLIFFGMHAGWIDTFNYNTSIVSHPLACLCSVSAIAFIHRNYSFVIPAILICASLSLYQPNVAAGFVLLFSLISKRIIDGDADILLSDRRKVLDLILTIIGGSIIYLTINHVYFEMTNLINERVKWISNIADLYTNIVIIYEYAYDNFFPNYIYKSTMVGVISFAFFLLFAGLLLRRASRQSTFHLIVATLIVVLFPVVAFAVKLPIPAELPVRAQANFGLFAGACAALVYEKLDWKALSGRTPSWLSYKLAALMAVTACFIASWFVITLAFDHQSRADFRDRQVASQILHDVYRFAREHDLPIDRFQIAGKRGVEPEKWYYPVAQNAFAESWGSTSIFRHVGFVGEDVTFVKNPDIDCAPWPHRGSVVEYQGATLVCLSEFKTTVRQ